VSKTYKKLIDLRSNTFILKELWIRVKMILGEKYDYFKKILWKWNENFQWNYLIFLFGHSYYSFARIC
jgi:hypothetical protein